MSRALLVLAMAAAIAGIAAPAAMARPAGRPGHAQAVAALQRAKDLRAGRGVHTGRELSPALARLAAALPSLSGGDRAQAVALLSRPDDPQTDPDGTHKWTAPEDPKSPACGTHYCIHWVKTSADAPDLTDADHNNVPDYVDQMLSVFENEVYPCENGTAPSACSLVPTSGTQVSGSTPGLGWVDPAPDGNLGGPSSVDKLDVYIEDLYPSGLFGYVAVDPGQPADPAVPHHAYMVLDKDFSRFAGGSAAGGLAEMRVTAAHEYNHVLQNAYDFLQDTWMFEATAVWMEEKVYPSINDYLQYVTDWVAFPAQPLTTFTKANLKPYGSAVWNHWLDHRYGPGVVRAAWEDSVSAANFAPAAYDAAILGAGGAGFSDEFDRFASTVAEWDVPGSGFPDPYPDVARTGTVPVGNVTSPFGLAHTTFAYFDVPVAPDAPPVIRLQATLPPGTSGAVALVGRTGGDPSAGTVTSGYAPIAAGGEGGVLLANPSSFGRITAVVVNSDFANVGFDQTANDYVFAHDAPAVTAQVDGPGPPTATTGGPIAIADHSATAGGAVDPHLIDTTWSIDYGKTTAYGMRTTPQQLPASTLVPASVSVTLGDLDARRVYHYRVVAANSAGQVAGGDMMLKTVADVTRPSLVIDLARRQPIKKVRARGLRYAALVSENASGSASIELGRRIARKLGLPLVLGKAHIALKPQAKPKAMRVTMARRVIKRLDNSTGSFPATLVVAVADASHNRRVVRRHILLFR